MKFSVLALFLFCVVSLSANAAVLQPLPKGDSFYKVVNSIGTDLADGNISTGTSDIGAGRVRVMPRNEREWEELSKDLFSETFNSALGESAPANRGFKTTVADFSAAQLEKGVRALAEANASDTTNPANLEHFRSRLWVLLRKLTDTKKGEKIGNIKVLASGARYLNETTESRRWVRTHTFVNTKTGIAFVLFTIEGTM